MSDSGEELRRAKVRTLRALRERVADRQSSRSQAPPQAINPPSAPPREPLQRHETAEQQDAWPLNRRVRIAGRAAFLRDASEENSGEALRRIASMKHASEAGARTARESMAAAVSNHGLPGNRGELGTTGFMRPNDTAVRPNTEAALLLELLNRVQGLHGRDRAAARRFDQATAGSRRNIGVQQCSGEKAHKQRESRAGEAAEMIAPILSWF